MTTGRVNADPLRRLKRELLAHETNTFPRLAPDGKQVMFVRTVADGQELWLLADDGHERRVAEHPGEIITDLRWTRDGSQCLYRHADRGREHWRLSAISAADLGRVTLQAPGPVVEYWLSPAHPSTVVYGSRNPRTRALELIRSDVDGRARPETLAASPQLRRWIVDSDLQPRGGSFIGDDGSVHILLGENLPAARTVLRLPAEELPGLAVLGFDRGGQQLFVLTSTGACTRRLVAIDAATSEVSEVFAHPSLDIESYPIAGEGVWFDPATDEPDICTVMDQRLRYHPLTAWAASAVAHLAATPAHSAVVIDRSADDHVWLIVAVRDDGPISYQLFDPTTGQTQPLFVNRPGLAGFALPKLEDFCFTASDGRRMSGYAMRPLDATLPLPTVVIVHGGPAGRDLWRFFADAQYLAALGYLSLHINYRGSRGFGVDFQQAGQGEWGGRMQEDLYDGVAAAATAGLVDADRVVFFGASYGGYAALLAGCTRPDIARCAIAISALTNLVSFASQPPPYWQSLAVLLHRQIVQRADGRLVDEATLRRRSPAHVLDGPCAPILLVHGERDPRVPIAEADDFAAAARSRDIPITYLRFPDEGHHVKSNTNRQTLFTAIEDFLEEHLGSPATSAEAALYPK